MMVNECVIILYMMYEQQNSYNCIRELQAHVFNQRVLNYWHKQNN